MFSNKGQVGMTEDQTAQAIQAIAKIKYNYFMELTKIGFTREEAMQVLLHTEFKT